MSAPVNLTGRRFGRLVVRGEEARRGHARMWHCACDCGSEIAAYQSNLRKGHTRSCGCLAKETCRTHGRSQQAEYRAWINMISRCENPKTPNFENYGGRGISVCPMWRASFEAFFTDIGARPTARHSVDRIDVNGNYEAGNCRWATQTEQCRNTRANRTVTFNGEEMPLVEAVQRLGLKYNTVLYRLRRGKSVGEALR